MEEIKHIIFNGFERYYDIKKHRPNEVFTINSLVSDIATKILKAIEGKLLTRREILEILESSWGLREGVKADAIVNAQTAKMKGVKE